MIVRRHNRFKKNYKKRIIPGSSVDKKFESRLLLFISDPNSPELKNHKLTGRLDGYKAFAITGDIRCVYRIVDIETVELYDIGSHNQVY